MAKELQDIGPVIREARHRHHMTQAELARFLETTQSAVSMFESGRAHSLALPKVEKAAARLGVDLKTGEISESNVTPPTARFARYCPNDLCPTNVPFTVGRERVFWPFFQDGGVAENELCPACATPMRDTCVNPACEAPAVKGSTHCPSCGTPYVVVTTDCLGDVGVWVKERCDQIQTMRRMIGMDEAGRW